MVQEIDPKLLISFGFSEKYGLIPYTHNNPAIRKVFWRRIKKMIESANDAKKNICLDFGCGGGILLPSLSKEFEKVYGIDIDINAAKQLKEYFKLNNVTLVEKDANNTDFDDDYFDVIFAADVLEHFKYLEEPLTEIKRILKPNGLLIVSAPTENIMYQIGRVVFGYKKPEDHYHTAEDINNKLSEYFDIVNIGYVPINIGRRLSLFEIIKVKKENKVG